MRKRLLILMSLVISLTSILSPVSATPSENDLERTFKEGLTDQQLELYQDFKNNGGNIEYLTNQQKSVIHTSEQKIKEIREYKQELSKNYREVGDTSISVIDDSGGYYLQHKVYDHKKEDKVIITTTFYDNDTGEIVRYLTSDVDSNSPGDVDQEIIYNNEQVPEFSTAGFKWQERVFMCGVLGLGACMAFCWSLKHSLKINIDTACNPACSVAMIIGCM